MRKIGRNRQQPQAAPFQRPTGQSKDGKVQKKIPGAESMIQCKSPGRTGQRAQPASLGSPRSRGGAGRFSSGGGTDGTARATFHRRATEDAGRQGFRFWRDFRGRMDYRRYGAGFVFLIRLLEKGWAVESAKRGARFLLSLYKNRDCFLFISSFLAGKEAKEAGGTYDGSPLTPFQRSTGTLSPSIAPAQ